MRSADIYAVLVDLGYENTTAQLLSVPPYAAAALLTIIVGYIADKTRQRGICAMVVAIFGIVGFAILLTDAPAGTKYAATFLAAMGIYPCVTNVATWITNNSEGVYKRGISVGVALGWANLQGCVVVNVYRNVDAPRFVLGHSAVLGYLTVALLGGSALHYVLLRRENMLRSTGRRDYTIEGKSEVEIRLMGDQR